MIRSGTISGHIDGNMFVRTEAPKKARLPKPSRRSVDGALKVLKDLLGEEDSIDIAKMEKETGIDRRILRRTLLILLGEGDVEGVFSGNVFSLDSKQSAQEFLRKFERELKTWSE